MRVRFAIFILILPITACGGTKPDGELPPKADAASAAGQHDWPQWQGPDRTNLNTETGLLKDWPKDGPPLVWTVHGMGVGFSTPSIAAGRIFLMGNRDSDECVIALRESDGGLLWSQRIAKAGSAGGYDGPRSTPTVVGDLLYTLGIDGDLVCLKVENGHEVWHMSLKKDFKGQVGGWGYAESPLVDGDKVVVAVGGHDATIVALNRADGQPVWKAQVPQQDHAAYASAIVAEVGGKRQYVYFLSGGVVGVAADDGAFLWRYDRPHNGTANCSTPLFHDGGVFAASGYGTGGGLAKIKGEGTSFSAEQVYFSKEMQNHHGGVLRVGEFVYGSNEGRLTCLDWHTGELKWDDRKPGKGSIAYADGRLYYRNEGSGDVFLVEATPEKYVEHGRLKQPERSGQHAWPHPVIANGKLYLRDQGVLLCYDIKEKK
ncbi:MAG: PQQ-binding-like beta-propeller repeat protein [Gemmataceae bacterium]